MRLPVEPPPVIDVATAPYEIAWRGAVSGSPKAAPRTLPPMINPSHTEEGGGHGGGGGETAKQQAAPLTPTGLPSVERRRNPDRRNYCRRVDEKNTLLDTRSEDDRRKQGRRADDPKLGVDLKV